jgi:hypothetical protein
MEINKNAFIIKSNCHLSKPLYMKIRDIIIIIILTMILAIASINTLEREPEIESIYLSSDIDLDFERLKLENDHNFNSAESNIYLIMKVNNLTVDDNIIVKWKKTEDANAQKVVQEDAFNPVQDGSGKIVILMVKKNNRYTAGKYCVEAGLNKSNNMISEQFSIESD